MTDQLPCSSTARKCSESGTRPTRIRRAAVTVAVAWFACATAAVAQQRPLTTEDPEPIGEGRLLVEGGFDYSWAATFPVSGLEGGLLRLPLVGISVGISSIAELQIDGGLYNRLSITDRQSAPLSDMVTATGPTTSSVEDIVVATKVRILAEAAGRPSIGMRFATKLPTASNESGLGLDTTDFYISALVGKTIRSVRTVFNVGMGILADPTRGDRQNDVLTYGVSFARALTNRAEVVGEVNGRLDTRDGEPPPGTESRGIARLGMRYTVGAWRADGAVLFGLTTRDPNFGVSGGFTYVFNAFRVP